MNEEVLGYQCAKIHVRRMEIESEEFYFKWPEPSKPTGTLNYSEASKYAQRKAEYDKKKARKHNNISRMHSEIAECERVIRRFNPVENTPIKVSGYYDNKEYHLIVTLVKNAVEDRIEIIEQK